jgi:hypothetical protein
MHWSKYLIVIVGVGFVLITIKNVLSVFSLWSGPKTKFEVLRDPGTLGIYDPSVEFDTHDRGVLAYSSVSQDPQSPYPTVGVNVSVEGAKAGRWFFNHTVFESKIDSYYDQFGTGQELPGVWRYEMPSIIYVPEDVGYEWKIFSYRYFWSDDINLARQSGVIVYRDTGDISTGQWSKEKWLFSANKYNPPAPYNSVVSLHINTLDESLSRVAAYSDPAAFYKDKTIYMTLAAYERNITDPDRIVMIASSDFGKTWRYVGDVFNASHLSQYGKYKKMVGGQIFEKDGREFFTIALGGEAQEFSGSFIFEFDDITKARLKTNDLGHPKLVKHYGLQREISELSALGGGQADYHEKSKAGFVMSLMLRPEEKKPFILEGRGHEFLEE